MINLPATRLGIVAVSRDCFPSSLSRSRRDKVSAACTALGLSVFVADTIVENEKDALKALEELKGADVNALVVYLGNFGPEGPETMLAQKFGGPCMYAAAAEEAGESLITNRGDAYCGMLNASYNLGLRRLAPWIPENPVGTPVEVAALIADFEKIARILLGVRNLKIFGFGPRPFDFLAFNAPIRPLFDLGVEIQENSELDLFESFNKHAKDPRIPGVIEDMAAELGAGNLYPAILEKLAQYELTLLDWYEANRGASSFAVFANKCWPAFQTMFGFVPCYVNSRLAARGIPVACETDIYGALTEYILACATQEAVTLLDINNTVPSDMVEKNRAALGAYKPSDLFMGFHCGNTPMGCLKNGAMKYQLIMKRLLEPDSEPNVSRGTLEGTLKAGKATMFRLQSTAEGQLTSYIAQGDVLDMDPESFGGIGVIAIPEMSRFYRHVLVAKRYPHHAGLAFAHVGRVVFAALGMLGVKEIQYNRPASLPYEGENPF